mmetsp:Transcript_24214/g.57141  ORF Transcript_24214/g.57141 Transcript_24214/m.57141 type:complete len:289 (+) Transcript_24214:963-1829(+)
MKSIRKLFWSLPTRCNSFHHGSAGFSDGNDSLVVERLGDLDLVVDRVVKQIIDKNPVWFDGGQELLQCRTVVHLKFQWTDGISLVVSRIVGAVIHDGLVVLDDQPCNARAHQATHRVRKKRSFVRCFVTVRRQRHFVCGQCRWLTFRQISLGHLVARCIQHVASSFRDFHYPLFRVFLELLPEQRPNMEFLADLFFVLRTFFQRFREVFGLGLFVLDPHVVHESLGQTLPQVRGIAAFSGGSQRLGHDDFHQIDPRPLLHRRNSEMERMLIVVFKSTGLVNPAPRHVQ